MFRKVPDQKPRTLRSQDWFDNPDKLDETAFHIERCTMKYSAFAMAAVIFAALSGAVRAETLESVKLAPVDYTFIGLTSLGNQFQIDFAKLGETHARSAAVRDYAKLMDTSHVQVQDNLMALLRRINVQPPPASLLAGAYKSLIQVMARNGERRSSVIT